MTKSRHENGFTLIEVMLVVTMIGIVGSIAMPSLSRAKAVAVETSTIGSLRAMSNAQATYASTCAGGFYAPSVTWLAAARSGKAAFIGPQFSTDAVTLQGYSIRFTPGPVVAKAPQTCNGLATGLSVQSYFVGADPLTSGPGLGVRHFGMSADGTIYQSTARVSAFYAGAPPAPAKPIQ